jgi:hypothetical protein
MAVDETGFITLKIPLLQKEGSIQLFSINLIYQ